jgi:hypothetical protein
LLWERIKIWQEACRRISIAGLGVGSVMDKLHARLELGVGERGVADAKKEKWIICVVQKTSPGPEPHANLPAPA